MSKIATFSNHIHQTLQYYFLQTKLWTMETFVTLSQYKKKAHYCDVNSYKNEPKLFPLPLDCMDIDDMAESDNSFHLHSRADSAAAETGLLLDRQLPARPGPCTEKRELQQDLVI